MTAKSWDKRLDEQRLGTIRQVCKNCGAEFWVPPCKNGYRRSCSFVCARALKGSAKTARLRPCETCGKVFSPRQIQITNGVGRFCSQACNTAARNALNTPEAMAKAAAGFKAAQAAGRVRRYKGPDNPKWKGGAKAYQQRRINSGASAAALRAYRKANPDKVLEFSKTRDGRKIGRLAYGTIPRLLVAQKHKCAICRASIRRGYHLDHIMPLARGGKHVASNAQLLCAPCNLTKSSRDPVQHMQSLGRLL